MLDLGRKLVLTDIPQAEVYRDDSRPDLYYLVPTTPAIDGGDAGQPEARLVIHLRREGGTRVIMGGQVTLTTTLATPPTEIQRIMVSIKAHRKPTLPPTMSPLGLDPLQLSEPPWGGGEVIVRLTDSWELRGQPSMFSQNRCVVMSSLDADKARQLHELWQRKIPTGQVVYEMTMRGVTSQAGSVRIEEQREATGPGRESTQTRDITVNVSGASTTTRKVVREGPLWVAGMESRLTEIDLSPR